MDKRYLTIGEFAKLRDMSIGSLRYYEKLGILVPAKKDEKTGYRYYLPEQIWTLDAVMLCTALDIPLKNMSNYLNENGDFDGRAIFEDGQKAMRKKIAEMQTWLEIARMSLDSMERNRKYDGKSGVYIRDIEERYFIETKFDVSKGFPVGAAKPMDLFFKAQEEKMAPVFPSGVVIRRKKEKVGLSCFFQVLNPDMSKENIVRIPAGKYSCLQVDLSFPPDIENIIKENFPDYNNETIIVSNMLLDKQHFDRLHSEIQIKFESGGERDVRSEI